MQAYWLGHICVPDKEDTMGIYTIKNENLSVMVVSLGAEIMSIRSCRTGQEYMWNANPIYWKRTSPILFPLVGNYKNKEVRYRDKVYSLPQHGFARDMEFEPVVIKQQEAWFRLNSTPETLQKYPFPFSLEVGYVVKEDTVQVIWRVNNVGEDTMYFSIGGHPAFSCPQRVQEKQSDYFLYFEGKEQITSRMICDGVATDELTTYPLDNGYLAIREDLFDQDALVIENRQAQKVSLCGPDKKPYVTVSFDAPLFGIWSVPGKTAPFVCIEPWYGRCDHKDFAGTLEQREWGNTLPAGDVFEVSYLIQVT